MAQPTLHRLLSRPAQIQAADAVRAVNAYRRGILGSIFCGWAGVEQSEYFEVADAAKEAPKVDFSDD